MRKLLLLLLCLLSIQGKAQTQRVLWPEDRANRLFISGLLTGVVYSTTLSLTNQNSPRTKHLPAVCVSLGASAVGGYLSYLSDKSSRTNQRQNLTAWFGSCVGTMIIIRIGLNKI